MNSVRVINLHYFYLLKNKDTFEVYGGWLSEGQEDDSYHWELIKTFK